MKYYIVYKYPGLDEEIVDEASSRTEAEELLTEYTLAYNRVGRVIISRNPKLSLVLDWES